MTTIAVPNHKIGDIVFKAKYQPTEYYVTCPDCGGTKHVKVTLYDGTEITIECGGCDPGGFEPSTGRIKQYEFAVHVDSYTVTGVNTTMKGVEYHLNNFGGGSYWTGRDEDVFAAEAEAAAHGELLRAEAEAEENKTLMSKTKNHRTWAWNATYHRKCITKLERELAYHHRKVEICAAKAKAGGDNTAVPVNNEA